MIQPYDQPQFLKSLAAAELANLRLNAEKYVLQKYYKHTVGDIQHYAETQLYKRGYNNLRYEWALLIWSCPKVNSPEAIWEEWADMVISWTKG